MAKKSNRLSFSPLAKLLILTVLIIVSSVVLIIKQQGVLGTSDSKSSQVWVGGYLYKDLNSNAERDMKEPGFANQQIILTQIGNKSQPLSGTKVNTDDNGYFQFRFKANSNAYAYSVQTSWPSGYTNTTPIAKKLNFSKEKKIVEFGVAYLQVDSCNKIKSVKYNKPCGDYASNTFRYTTYVCADGTKGSLGGSTSCKTTDVWSKYVNEICSSHGSACLPTPTPTPFLIVTPTSEPVSPTPTKEITPTPIPPTPTSTDVPTPTSS